VPLPTVIPALRQTDRCDSCGAQAYAAAWFGGYPMPLLFCGHHFTRWEARIRETADQVRDERPRIAEAERARKSSAHTN
jgi:hypothetical protein